MLTRKKNLIREPPEGRTVGIVDQVGEDSKPEPFQAPSIDLL
jgi:hypothetical protein